MKANLDGGVKNVINIEAQAIKTSSEAFRHRGTEHPPKHEKEETIAGKSKRTKVKQFILVRIVLCQLKKESIKFMSGSALEEYLLSSRAVQGG